MGVPKLWEELDQAAKPTTLEGLAWKYFQHSQGKAIRIGIDSSLWLFHAKSMPADAGPFPSLLMIFNRLCNLFDLPILPVFVYDGPERPKEKRGRRVFGAYQDSVGTKQMQELVSLFGFEQRLAPGEAEAELAWMNSMDLIDVVLTDDIDAFLFGAVRLLRK